MNREDLLLSSSLLFFFPHNRSNVPRSTGVQLPEMGTLLLSRFHSMCVQGLSSVLKHQERKQGVSTAVQYGYANVMASDSTRDSPDPLPLLRPQHMKREDLQL